MNVAAGFPRPFGRYILEKSISRGGMGEVFLAVAKGVYKRCVIKTIRTDLHGEREFVGRFTDEAKIMVRIDHPNIIRVFDCGKVGADYYIAMEYVHGRDLGDVLDRAYERGEPMPTSLGLYVASQLLAGLAYVHDLTDERGRSMGLVHRDISPQNVLIGFDGSVKLIDFGLARTDLLPPRTQGALAVGKYGYMSPEQARHEQLDGRADIYSTGVMLFEVFTGDRLVDEQDQATLWQRVLNPSHRPPRSVVPTLPPEIDELIMTAVATKPAQRFSSCHKMRSFCERLLEPRDHVQALLRYLKYLYPKVDFKPPPVPNLEGFAGRVDESVIIATSRERQRSVFGRGELPVEGTMQFDAKALRRALADRKSRVQVDDTLRGPPQTFEEPRLRFDADSTGSETMVSTDLDNHPTQIGTHPLAGPMDDDTRVQSGAPRAQRVDSNTGPIPSGAGLGEPDDDERTVMMDFTGRERAPTDDPILDATVLSRRRPDEGVRVEAALAPAKPIVTAARRTVPQGRFAPVEDIRTDPPPAFDSPFPPTGSTNDGEGGDKPQWARSTGRFGVEPRGNAMAVVLVLFGACILGFLTYGILSLF